ncbi:unnamed protein product [Cuscuta epithymum]|uniref:Uncharacterized protein n=1 Tax=Cuscuta epithymum TaxID=186058 RepID=A0AAV0FM89_9ASTE|nr:unnamed protein product [Cuscuta epithymum]
MRTRGGRALYAPNRHASQSKGRNNLPSPSSNGGRALYAPNRNTSQSRGRNNLSSPSSDSALNGSHHSSGEESTTQVPSTPTSPCESNGQQSAKTNLLPFSLSDMHSRKTHSEIKQIMRSSFNGPWRSYRKVPIAERDHWFDEFRVSHLFPDSAKKQFREYFDKYGSQGLKKMLQDARDASKCPEYIAENDWKDLQTYWASPEFKKLSAKGKKARSSELCRNNPYCGGSITTYDHKKKLRKILGRKILMRELYAVTWKKKKTREWSGPRLKMCYENFIAARQKVREQVSDHSQPINEDEIFLEEFGSATCGKIFGLGSLSKDVQNKRGNTTTPMHSEDLQELVDQRVKAALTTNIQELLKGQVQTAVQATIEEVDRRWVARFVEYRNSLNLYSPGFPMANQVALTQTLAPNTSTTPFQQFPFSQMTSQGQPFTNGAMSFTDMMNFGSSLNTPFGN